MIEVADAVEVAPVTAIAPSIAVSPSTAPASSIPTSSTATASLASPSSAPSLASPSAAPSLASPSSAPAIAWAWLGRVDHADAVAAQEARRTAILAGDAAAQAVLLCEHPPVITLGRSADRRHVLIDDAEAAARGITIAPVSRGGDVTYHGPGQLMIYPVVRVARVVPFLAAVAGELAALCAELGVPGAAFRREPAGLWLDDHKLAACGIHLSRGVAIHGWAWNIATPLDAWRTIVPCGLTAPLVSLADACAARGLPPPPPLAALAARLGPRLARALATR